MLLGSSMLWLVVVSHLVLNHLLLSSLSLRHHHRLHANRHVTWVHHLRWMDLLLRHLLHHNRLFEHIDVARILNIVNENVQLGFADAFLLQEILDSVQIKAHL